MILTVTKIVFKCIVPILQSVECLVLNLPPGSPASRDDGHSLLIEFEVRDPTEMPRFLPADLPIFQHADTFLGILLVQRGVAEPPVVMEGAVRIDQRQNLNVAILFGLLELLEEGHLFAGFDAQNEARVVFLEHLDVGPFGAEGIFHNDHWQFGMFFAEVFHGPNRSAAFPIPFVGAILLDDGFRAEWDDFTPIGMDQSHSQHLVIVTDNTVAAAFLQTVSAMNGVGSKVSGAVASEQIVPLEINEAFEVLAPLEASKHGGERWAKVAGVHLIKDFTHPGVAGDLFDPEEGLQIEGIALAFSFKGQKGRTFEVKDGEPAQQGIGQRNRWINAFVGDGLELIANDPD